LISEDVADGKHVPLHTESESVAGLLRSKLRSLSSSSDFTWLAKEKPEFSIFALFHDAPRHRQDSHRLVKWGIAFFGVMLAVALVIMALMMIGACVLRQAVQSGIEKPYDWKEVLGVDVELEGFVSPFTGMVEVKNLLLRNPPGYEQPYLIMAQKLLIDIDMLKFTWSGFKHICVDTLICDNVDITFEKSLHQSNIKYILKRLADDVPSTPRTPDLPASVQFSPASPRTAKIPKTRSLEKCVNTSPMQMILHTVHLVNVTAKITSIQNRAATRVPLPDITCNDFNVEIGGTVFEDIVQSLVVFVLKTVLAKLDQTVG